MGFDCPFARILQGSARRLVKAALQEAAKKREMRYSDLKKIDRGVRRHFHDDITVIVVFLDSNLVSRASSLKGPSLSLRGGGVNVPANSLAPCTMPTQLGASWYIPLSSLIMCMKLNQTNLHDLALTGISRNGLKDRYICFNLLYCANSHARIVHLCIMLLNLGGSNVSESTMKDHQGNSFHYSLIFFFDLFFLVISSIIHLNHLICF